MIKLNVNEIFFGLKTNNFDPTKICATTVYHIEIHK